MFKEKIRVKNLKQRGKMTKTESLPIYIEAYRLIQEIFRCTLKFPKEYKFTIGNSLNEDAVDLCSLISKANHTTDKISTLDDFLSCLERVKVQIRLCVDFNLFSCSQQAFLAHSIEKITTQALAWIKSERRKQQRP